MKILRNLPIQLAVTTWFALIVWPVQPAAHAQTSPPQEGQNAAVSHVGPFQTQPTPAFVDAGQWLPTSSSSDICLAIQSILNSWITAPPTSSGLVIDGRGIIPQPSQTAVSCSVNPWSSNAGSQYQQTILLPAQVIAVQKAWVIPDSVKIVGAGSGLTPGSSGPTGVTVLRACTTSMTPLCTGVFTDSDMLDMGSGLNFCPNQDCQAVVIEHVQLDGNGLGMNGIKNTNSQELSYVNDVKLTNFSGGTGLLLTSASNSGPYTKIYYSGMGPCVSISSTVDTRGIHGLTCITSNSPVISIDASNESIEDVTIQPTGSGQDGILIGSQGMAQSNVLFNINGKSLANLVHISSHVTGTVPNAADQTMMGLTCTGCTATILDDLTVLSLTDSSVGIYAIGEQVVANGASGYSRFTTSPSVPSWLVGTMVANGSCTTGSLYSCTNSTNCPATSKTLYGCAGGSWVGIR